MKFYKQFLNPKSIFFFDSILVLLSLLAGLISFWFYFTSGNNNLADYDSIARLNIARKIFDSLTPGFGQLGGIWLPFPQILMVPFVFVDFLWHSGIAGAFISIPSFVAACYLIYKTVFLITGKRIAAFIGWFVFMTNINYLYYQSTAMSEPFFIFCVCGTLYFLIRWAKMLQISSLLYCSIFLIFTTLTRYEGYFIFLATCLSVIVWSLYSFGIKKYTKIEGTFFLFFTLASFGIFLWMFYSFLIFKDPIYFLHLYSGTKDAALGLQQTANNSINIISNKRNIWDSFNRFSWAVLLTNGIFVSLTAIMVFFVVFINNIILYIKSRKITLMFLVPLIFLVSYGLFVFGYYGGLIPPIETPALALGTLLDKINNFSRHSNIRYGLLPLPFFALLLGFASSSRWRAGIIFVLLITQLYFIFNTKYFFFYEIPKVYKFSQLDYSTWMKHNYDGGYILVSANRHENFMFQTGLPYNSFIYEGNQKYWYRSLEDPASLARWVVYDSALSGDAVTEQVKNFDIIYNKYDMVYKSKTVRIYKIKMLPIKL